MAVGVHRSVEGPVPANARRDALVAPTVNEDPVNWRLSRTVRGVAAGDPAGAARDVDEAEPRFVGASCWVPVNLAMTTDANGGNRVFHRRVAAVVREDGRRLARDEQFAERES